MLFDILLTTWKKFDEKILLTAPEKETENYFE